MRAWQDQGDFPLDLYGHGKCSDEEVLDSHALLPAGHSLGGAMAILAAHDVASQCGVPNIQVRCIHLSPRCDVQEACARQVALRKDLGVTSFGATEVPLVARRRHACVYQRRRGA